MCIRDRHIFEPRYKRMIKNSIKSGDPFGIVFQDKKGFKSIGCSVKIINVIKEYPTGEFDIIVEGQHCFHIQNKIQENDNLWIGTISFLKDEKQINQNLLEKAKSDAIFLHCLPAHREEEVTSEVIDGPSSRVWQQAHNRLYTSMALIEFLLLTD